MKQLEKLIFKLNNEKKIDIVKKTDEGYYVLIKNRLTFIDESNDKLSLLLCLDIFGG